MSTAIKKYEHWPQALKDSENVTNAAQVLAGDFRFLHRMVSNEFNVDMLELALLRLMSKRRPILLSTYRETS